MSRDVSVIVPTYQEAATIVGVVDEVLYALGDRDPEVVVVDDSPSTDTVDALEAEFGNDSRVRWVHRQEDGLASAVVDGFELAEGECYAVLDGDGQHPPTRLPDLVRAVEHGADVAVASRHRADTETTADWGLTRYAVSFGGALLAWAALPPARQHLQDPMSGFFAVDAKAVDPSLAEPDPRGYKMLLGLPGRCPVRRIAQVPCEFRDRDAGKSNLDRSEYLAFAAHALELAWVYRTRPTVEQLPQEVATDGGR